MGSTAELIHRPLGDRHPYESAADERVPRHPFPHDPVELGALTRPIGSVQKVTASYWVAENPELVEYSECSLTESVPSEIAFTEDGHLSEAAARAGLTVGVDRWLAQLPPFPAETTVCYQLTAESGDETISCQVHTYTVRKVTPLDEVIAIFQESQVLVFELQNADEHQRGFLRLYISDEGHVRVEVGHGDCPENDGATQIDIDTATETRFRKNLGNIQVQAELDDFKLQLFYRGELIISGLRAPQLVIGDDEIEEAVILTFDSPPGEGFYGFGERFNALNQRGQCLDVRVYEQYKNHGLRTYLPMPLFVSSQGYGLLVQSQRYSKFDLACKNPASWSLQSELGEQKSLELDILLGDSSQLLEIVARLSSLTGRPVLPPDWAFGLWMSSNEWNTQARLEEMVKQNEAHGIPASVIVLEAWSDENTFYIWNDAQYTPKPGNEFFHYDDFEFPENGMWHDPKGMVAVLHEKGLRVLLWQIPVLKVNEDNHPQLANDTTHMLENDYCVHHIDGEPYRNRPFWFHDGLLMDFTHPQGVDWWMGKRAYLLTDIGIDGFKTDGGEHIWGRDLVFADGRGSDEVWNEYPNQYAGTYFQFARQHKPDAITFSRAGYTGTQAFPGHWAGDENSTWEAFRHSILAGLSAGISGIAFWGWDFAGFSGEIPTAELYLRTAAMATFCPIMQYHSEYNHHRKPCNDRTPWNIAERTQSPKVLSMFRYFAHIRMNLLPYILNAARQSASTGVPMMRAQFLAYPQNDESSACPYQYLFGDSLLVAPIVEPGLSEIEVYLPQGEWVSFWDESLFTGNTTHTISTSLAQIPVFVKANSVIPMNLDKTFSLGSDVGNHTAAYDQLCFKVFPNADGEYIWYDELAQTEIQFVWEEISAGKYILQIDMLTRPIHIMLPNGFTFDQVDDKQADRKKIVSLADASIKNIRIAISKSI